MAGDLIRGRPLKEEMIAEAAEAAVASARPLPMNHLKVDLTKAIVREALMSIIETKKRRSL